MIDGPVEQQKWAEPTLRDTKLSDSTCERRLRASLSRSGRKGNSPISVGAFRTRGRRVSEAEFSGRRTAGRPGGAPSAGFGGMAAPRRRSGTGPESGKQIGRSGDGAGSKRGQQLAGARARSYLRFTSVCLRLPAFAGKNSCRVCRREARAGAGGIRATARGPWRRRRVPTGRDGSTGSVVTANATAGGAGAPTAAGAGSGQRSPAPLRCGQTR